MCVLCRAESACGGAFVGGGVLLLCHLERTCRAIAACRPTGMNSRSIIILALVLWILMHVTDLMAYKDYPRIMGSLALLPCISD